MYYRFEILKFISRTHLTLAGWLTHSSEDQLQNSWRGVLTLKKVRSFSSNSNKYKNAKIMPIVIFSSYLIKLIKISIIEERWLIWGFVSHLVFDGSVCFSKEQKRQSFVRLLREDKWRPSLSTGCICVIYISSWVELFVDLLLEYPAWVPSTLAGSAYLRAVRSRPLF